MGLVHCSFGRRAKLISPWSGAVRSRSLVYPESKAVSGPLSLIFLPLEGPSTLLWVLSLSKEGGSAYAKATAGQAEVGVEIQKRGAL